jgi:AcrR family transcriptional regulator
MDTAISKDNGHLRTRRGTALRQRGIDRVKKILAAAEEVLLNEGYASFSLRNVAEKTGISLGNLTYYFKSKDDLFQSLIDDVVAGYQQGLQEIANAFPDDHESKFLGYMDYLLADCRKPRSHQFFYHFWALSTHDRFVASRRRRGYEILREMLTEVCRALNSKLSTTILDQRVYLLMAMIEGMHVMFGNQKKPPRNLDRIAGEFRSQTLAIVRAP